MSQYGYLIFYSTQPHGDPVEMTERLLSFIGATKALLICRTTRDDREWDALQAFLAGRGDDDISTPYESIAAKDKGLKELASLYQPGTHLTLDLAPGPWFADKIAAAVKDRVSVELRGDFIPCQLFVDVGYHDHIETVEAEYGRLLGRAFCSVRLFGYGTPNDWEGTRVAILALPQVAEARQQLAEIIGPVDTCIHWSQ